MRAALILLLAGALAMTACGRRSDPVPPSAVETPAEPADEEN
jgi:hypothetical protein